MAITILFDERLDRQLEQALPDAYRGGHKTRLRAEYAAREWLSGRCFSPHDTSKLGLPNRVPEIPLTSDAMPEPLPRQGETE